MTSHAPAAVVALEVALVALVIAVVAVRLVTLVNTVGILVTAPHVRNTVLLLHTLELVGAARRLRCEDDEHSMNGRYISSECFQFSAQLTTILFIAEILAVGPTVALFGAVDAARRRVDAAIVALDLRRQTRVRITVLFVTSVRAVGLL